MQWGNALIYLSTEYIVIGQDDGLMDFGIARLRPIRTMAWHVGLLVLS